VEQVAFEGPSMNGPKVSAASNSESPSVLVSPARSRNSEDEEAVLCKQMAAVQTTEGVLRVPRMSRLAWYNMNKTPK
jgi:hypothetical protein